MLRTGGESCQRNDGLARRGQQGPEGSHVSGMTVSPDEVNKEAVVMQFKRLVGGQDVVMELGSPWSWLALQVFAVLLS